MALADDIEKLERKRNNTRFAALVRICQENFGNPRINGAHHIFKTPWKGDPRINLQTQKGSAKGYQVDQVVEALRRLQEMEEAKKRKDKGYRIGD
jgi:hypothetical protein